jgi:hypothetical protein
MDADLDLVCTAVYCTADDLLPARPANARRELTDAEIVTLALAQVLMGVPSDRRFLRAARRQLGHLFPTLPSQSAFHKRRVRLRDTIEWLTGVFADASPGSKDTLLVLDSTPLECGRSVDTARRSELAEACGYGYSRSHSRWFWGMRLHGLFALDGTPRAVQLAPADQPERPIGLVLIERAAPAGSTIVCDKGYAGQEFETAANQLGTRIARPQRRDEQAREHSPISPIRQRVESIFWTLKDLLTLERHGARTLDNLRARIATRLLALASCVWLNHQLGRPPRAIANYTA